MLRGIQARFGQSCQSGLGKYGEGLHPREIGELEMLPAGMSISHGTDETRAQLKRDLQAGGDFIGILFKI